MKSALVTGGSRGIGKAVCLRLAAKGYYILVNYRSNSAEAEKTLGEIRAAGGDGELLPFDVADKEQIKTRLGGWIETHPDGCIEVLVNNAGIKEDALMVWMEDEQWSRVIATKLEAFLATPQASYISAEILSVNGGLYS